MKRLVILLTLALSLVLALAYPSAARSTVQVTGGGTGTFDADLDGDGQIDGSQFGMMVSVLGGGAATGRFKCLMAGRSDILGLHLMSVEGRSAAARSTPMGASALAAPVAW